MSSPDSQQFGILRFTVLTLVILTTVIIRLVASGWDCVMNIMLISVTERHPGIGDAKFGAAARTFRLQFCMEGW